MNPPKLLLALLLAVHLGPAVAAGPGDLGNLSGQTVNFGNTFAFGGSFSDSYMFDIDQLSAAVGTSVTINLDLPYWTGAEFELSNMSIRFTDSIGNILASDAQSSPSDTTLTALVTLPAASDYRFIVSGNITGTLGGSYGGVLQAYPVSAPVPEADAYLFMALGMGLVGLLARRRKA